MTKYRGEIPSQFVSMTNNISVTSESIYNFSATYFGNSDLIRTNWYYYDDYYSAYFTYGVYGSAEDVSSFSAPTLPYEIIVLNESVINLNNLYYSGTTFSESNYFNDYKDYVKQIYNQPNSSNVVREYAYSKTIYGENKKNIDVIIDDLEEIQPIPFRNTRR